MTAGTTTATTITISWTSAGSEDVSYEVMWERDITVECSGFSDMDSNTITDGSTSYYITELEEDSTYSITVTASNSAGSSAVSNTVTAMTMEAGERQPVVILSFLVKLLLQLLLLLLLQSVLLVHLLLSQSNGDQ